MVGRMYGMHFNVFYSVEVLKPILNYVMSDIIQKLLLLAEAL